MERFQFRVWDTPLRPSDDDELMAFFYRSRHGECECLICSGIQSDLTDVLSEVNLSLEHTEKEIAKIIKHTNYRGN